ncbi:hypothetical protein BH23GEM6_BH23GEM6_08930 [soil metagenome]
MIFTRALSVLLMMALAGCAPRDDIAADEVERRLASLDLRGRLAQLVVVDEGQALTLDGGQVAAGGNFQSSVATLTIPAVGSDTLPLPLRVGAMRPPNQPSIIVEPEWVEHLIARTAAGEIRDAARAAGLQTRAPGLDLALATLSSDMLTHLPSNVRAPDALAERVDLFFSAAREAGPLLALEIFSLRGGDTAAQRWDLARIEALEGVALTAAIRAGLSAVVLPFTAVPAITGDTLPLPFSPATAAFLRRDHAWNGVIAVDLSDNAHRPLQFTAEEAAVRSLAAGVDLLLRPPEPQRLLDTLQAAVADGRLRTDRVDQAVRSVIRLKMEAEQRRSPPAAGAPVPPPIQSAAPVPPDAPTDGVQPSSASAAGMDEALLRRADAAIQKALADGLFTAGVLAVSRNGHVVRLNGYGSEPGGGQVSADGTLFDLASLTKVVATTTAVALLVERGKLTLNTPVQSLLPGLRGENKELINIHHLLTHTSGLPPGLWLFGSARSPEAALQQVLTQRLRRAPGQQAEYSDLGMILLARAAEVAAGEPLDRFLARDLFAPLGMTSSMFLPPLALHQRTIPSALRNERGFTLQGVVHDANAFRLGGVAGHAGLFSTGRDLLIFGQMMLQAGSHGGVQILQPETVTSFTRRRPGADTRALGWDTPADRSSAGRLLSARSFGHTGYTGTSLWIDPELSLVVVLLTNRTYDRGSPAEILALRRTIHEAVASAITDRPVRPRPGAR